jgi:hypothetical protein
VGGAVVVVEVVVVAAGAHEATKAAAMMTISKVALKPFFKLYPPFLSGNPTFSIGLSHTKLPPDARR